MMLKWSSSYKHQTEKRCLFTTFLLSLQTGHTGWLDEEMKSSTFLCVCVVCVFLAASLLEVFRELLLPWQLCHVLFLFVCFNASWDVCLWSVHVSVVVCVNMCRLDVAVVSSVRVLINLIVSGIHLNRNEYKVHILGVASYALWWVVIPHCALGNTRACVW